MEKIRLALACMMDNGIIFAGESTVIDAPTSLFDFFHTIALTSNEDVVKGFFKNPLSNPVLFNSIGVYSTPIQHIHFQLDSLVKRFGSDFHTGSVCLLFKDQQWQILSRITGHMTDDFVPLNYFIAKFYRSIGISQEEIDGLGLGCAATAQVFLNGNKEKTFLYFDSLATQNAA